MKDNTELLEYFDEVILKFIKGMLASSKYKLEPDKVRGIRESLHPAEPAIVNPPSAQLEPVDGLGEALKYYRIDDEIPFIGCMVDKYSTNKNANAILDAATKYLEASS